MGSVSDFATHSDSSSRRGDANVFGRKYDDRARAILNGKIVVNRIGSGGDEDMKVKGLAESVFLKRFGNLNGVRQDGKKECEHHGQVNYSRRRSLSASLM